MSGDLKKCNKNVLLVWSVTSSKKHEHQTKDLPRSGMNGRRRRRVRQSIKRQHKIKQQGEIEHPSAIWNSEAVRSTSKSVDMIPLG